ncbi:hypothetical protein GCM10020256_44480 [Streptomyces thermocoprophilus]
MPVGQEVTATIRKTPAPSPPAPATSPPAAVASAAAPSVVSAAAPEEAATGDAAESWVPRAALSPAGATAPVSAGASPRISAAADAGSSAARRAAVKSAFINWRARDDRIVRWASSAPAGAAIRKIRSAGPSAAPKSIPAALRPNASVGSVTWALRQWGMPIPPSRPVGICASRAATSARKPSRSVTRPRATMRSARARAAASLVSADRSRSTRSAVIMSLIAGSLARVPPVGSSGRGVGTGTGMRWGVWSGEGHWAARPRLLRAADSPGAAKGAGRWGDRGRRYGDGDGCRWYGDRSRRYGDQDGCRWYGDRSRRYGDKSRPYGDRSRPYGDGVGRYAVAPYGNGTDRYPMARYGPETALPDIAPARHITRPDPRPFMTRPPPAAPARSAAARRVRRP